MAQDIFIFKVALMRQKSIWRKIALEGNDSLDDLHEMIHTAFDRYDEHLYSFYFPVKQSKSIRVIVRNSVEYTSPNTLEFGGDDGQGNAAKATLSSLRLKPKQKMYYLFDFGDEWWHEITVEAVDAPREKGKYPRIVASKGESPAQYPNYDEDEDDY